MYSDLEAHESMSHSKGVPRFLSLFVHSFMWLWGGGRSASMSKMEGLEHPVVETELRIYSHHTNEVLRPLNLPKIVFNIFTFYRPPVCNSYIFSQNNGVM